MKKLLTLLCGLWISNANAQTYFPFPDSNATWSYVACYNINPSPPPWVVNCSTYYYLFAGDTIYNSLVYHKLTIYYDSSLTTGFDYGLIRQDTVQKKVFYFEYGVGIEKMLYNFNANIGDTLSEVANTIVTMTDSILTNTGYRKRFYTNLDYVVDGIGSFYDLVYRVSLEATYNLSCFTKNGNLIYMNPNYSSCNVVLGTPEIIDQNSKISIYPNPVFNCSRLIINHSLKNDIITTLFDYTGRIIFSNIKSNIADFVICKESLKPGYYILRVDDNKQVYSASFIVS